MNNKTDLPKIKIGLDFHGVITNNPKFFKEFTALALNRGYEIHIITGGPVEKVEKQLQEWQISYSKIFALLDYYEAQGKVTYFPNGEFQVDEALWNSAKAKYCATHNINFHIDDSKIYASGFSTPFCHYQQNNNACMLAQTEFDLEGSATAALDTISQFVSQSSLEHNPDTL